MKKTILSIVCLAAAGNVLAGPTELFAKYDKNKDGVISKDEYLAMRASFKSGKEPGDVERSKKFFARKDKDKNGSLSVEEFIAK